MFHIFFKMQFIASIFLIFNYSLFSQSHSAFAVNGKISYLELGQGSKTYLMLPGIGETKEGYHPLIQELIKSGKIYSLDIRGQGESSTDFDNYSALEVAKDTIQFMDEKKIKKAILIGSSLSAASAIYIGAKRPDLVQKVVLSGPFVRDHELGFGIKTLISLGFRSPWGAGFWKDYYRDLHITVQPKDLSEQSERIYQYLLLEGRLTILRKYLFSSKVGCEEKLDSIQIPVIVVMGGKDPDFDNPEEELNWIVEKTKGSKYLFEDSGHYPHREEPKRFAELIK